MCLIDWNSFYMHSNETDETNETYHEANETNETNETNAGLQYAVIYLNSTDPLAVWQYWPALTVCCVRHGRYAHRVSACLM